jgi:hypothetical protein
MKYLLSFLLLVSLSNCGDNKIYSRAENALDAGREFIDGCLKGEFEKAEFYMVKDSTNNNMLLSLKRKYKEKSDAQKKEYKDASITIFEDAVLNDSTHIINYQNSYDKVGHKVKVILQNSNWLVDLKYTFDGNL